MFDFCESGTEKVYARISFHIKSGLAQSPLRAPFGSVEVYKRLNEIQLKEFLEKVQGQLVKLGIKEIAIRNFPELYDKHLSQQVNGVLRKLQFTQQETISSIIQVSEKTFDKKIKVSERQKLKKAIELFQIEQIDSSDLKKIYSFIATCRKERNQSLSMSLGELQKTISVFPDRFYLFKASRKDEIAASAIVIQVSKKILYTFYYAHAKKYNRVSPVVFLIAGIYDFASNNKYELIDLGTSMIDGHVSRSLLHFKKSIGGISSGKVTYTKSL
ncbi:MAG TPA: hypothetical protein PKJ83_02480 [Cyclobacteriaceae bacterium]|nr:hypothetical protein [Cyclobacteriaceae bacterium]HPW61085.1 hypothetical protein [Cyclobacteriaceae bacterium]